MNSDTRETIDGFIRDAGSVSKCDICGNYDVWADDSEADKKVYAMATSAWKDGAFRGASRQAIMDLVRSALADVNVKCPSCGQNFADD